MVDGAFRLGGGECGGGETEGAADELSAATLRGEGVDVGVTDHDGFMRGDRRCDQGGGLCDEGEETGGVGLLGVEGVAAVVLEEEGLEVEGAADVARWVHGFVGEHGHGEILVAGADLREGVEDAIVAAGVVELVSAIVGEEEVEGAAEEVVAVAGVEGVEIAGIAKSAADEHGSSVTDVTGDQGVGQGRLAYVDEGGVYGVAEVERGVDERTVKIEDQQAGWNTNHGASVAAPPLDLKPTRG